MHAYVLASVLVLLAISIVVYCTVLIDLYIIIIRNRLNYMIDITVYFRTALSILFTVSLINKGCSFVILEYLYMFHA